MATTDQRTPTGSVDAESMAETIREAALVTMFIGPSGDSLAAAGTLVAACTSRNTPFHVSSVHTPEEIRDRVSSMDDPASAISLGSQQGSGRTERDLVSVRAYESARELGTEPDPLLALAGIMSAGENPDEVAPELLDEAGVGRRPGLAIPTNDIVDGITHSTLVHTPYSGDHDAAQAAVDDLDLQGDIHEQDYRTVASVLVLDTLTDTPSRAASAIERVLRPYQIPGPFATLGGYADVLNALATDAPGLGLTLTLQGGARSDALEVWREHAQSTHEAVRSATLDHSDGHVVTRIDTGPIEPVARLIRDYRTSEPVVLVVSTGEAAIATDDITIESALEAATDTVDGSCLYTKTGGVARFSPENEDAFITAFTEAL